MTSELITFNHLRCHSTSTAMGTRTGYWKPTWRSTDEATLSNLNLRGFHFCSLFFNVSPHLQHKSRNACISASGQRAQRAYCPSNIYCWYDKCFLFSLYRNCTSPRDCISDQMKFCEKSGQVWNTNPIWFGICVKCFLSIPQKNLSPEKNECLILIFWMMKLRLP